MSCVFDIKTSPLRNESIHKIKEQRWRWLKKQDDFSLYDVEHKYTVQDKILCSIESMNLLLKHLILQHLKWTVTYESVDINNNSQRIMICIYIYDENTTIVAKYYRDPLCSI